MSWKILIALAIIATTCAINPPGTIPSPTNCAPCSRKPTTHPVLDYIPDDNYCKPGQTTEEILVQLYNALGGPNWVVNRNWLTGDYCTWYGVVCNQNRDVTTIHLDNNNVTGDQIPPSIGCLTYLKALNLDYNNISGQIPRNLCNLKYIQYLTLPYNNLGGTIPPCFSDLVFLLHLYLQGNGLVGVLPDFSRYTSIKEIHVDNNCLTGDVPQAIPPREIVDLHFSNNNFSGCIPDFYAGISRVNFDGNDAFCTQAYKPCFLSTELLQCPSRQFVNVQGPFIFCPKNGCLSIAQ